ncbi:putative zinc finger protein At1g68190 [Rosa rugosa]|uniref:putative zinc finger protein At1g68190 n=1 Tax=Rosa rugosa TaxID=74645 RepID=UPI002B411FBE|nr:putative zinc finger protein At1g68190 [Rosa rugosa]
MEKICEFCLASRPVVHCKADAAHLCVSCDAKIHSANAIVNRHHRTVLCDSCNYLSAYVQCLDHNDHRIRLMCHFCDQSQHEISSSRLHPKRQFSGYTGCPSAGQFAAMWGFQLNDDITLSITSSYCVEHLNTLGHQILHLKRLQLTDQETSINIDSNSVHQLIYGQEQTSHHLSSNTSSTVGVPLHTESIWQWTSPVQSTSQVDSQNVQDQIQVCKKLTCPDDSNLSNAECLAVLNFELGLLVDDDDDNNHDDVPLSYASSTMDESRAEASIHINGSSSSSTSSSVFCTIPGNVCSCGLKGEEHLEVRAKAMIRYKEKKRSRSHAKTI